MDKDIIISSDSGLQITERELRNLAFDYATLLKERKLIYFKMRKINAKDLLHYLALLRGRNLLIVADADADQFMHDEAIKAYKPQYIYEDESCYPTMYDISPKEDKCAVIALQDKSIALETILEFDELALDINIPSKSMVLYPYAPYTVEGIKVLHTILKNDGTVHLIHKSSNILRSYWRKAQQDKCNLCIATDNLMRTLEEGLAISYIPDSIKMIKVS